MGSKVLENLSYDMRFTLLIATTKHRTKSSHGQKGWFVLFINRGTITSWLGKGGHEANTHFASAHRTQRDRTTMMTLLLRSSSPSPLQFSPGSQLTGGAPHIRIVPCLCRETSLTASSQACPEVCLSSDSETRQAESGK